jgi:hypothetical protein
LKAHNLRKWSLSPKIEGLLFFAQLVDELLFDYTIDTYKIPALNTKLLAHELYSALKEHEDNALRYGAIEPIANELQNRLKKDPVVKEILKDYFEEFIKSLGVSQNNLSDLKTSVLFLINKISDKYLKLVEHLLKKEIVDKPESKERITTLTRIYLVELFALGYSSAHIFFESERFFFSGNFPQKIDNVDLIDTYFKIFSGNKKIYNVILKGNKYYSLIKDYAKKLDIEITTKKPFLTFYKKSENVKEYLSEDSNYPLYLIIKNIESVDTTKARELAYDKLNLIDSLAKYNVHRTNFAHIDAALAYSDDEKDFSIVKAPTPPTLKRPDRSSEKLSELIDETVTAIVSKKLDPESLMRLFRALKQHYTGLISTTKESQLLGLWSALEVIFPPKFQGDDRIKQISDSIVPFICSGYAAKLSADLYNSIKNAEDANAIDLLKKVPEGDNNIEKCLALLSIRSNERIRDEIRNNLTWNPNLRNRIFYLSKKLSTGGEFHKTLKAHIERVSWQIRRIYRTRNMIIHTGKTVPYLNVLLENLHSYLDRVLDLLIKKIIRCPHTTSIDQSALEIKLELEAHLRKVESYKKSECTVENYKLILFGQDPRDSILAKATFDG